MTTPIINSVPDSDAPRMADFTRRVTTILNGLVRVGDLIRDGNEWKIDQQYTPATAASWAGTPPTSVAEALDRCAALLKTLNAGVGP